MSRRTLPFVLAAVTAIGLAAASPAVAKSDHKTVVISDDCDPATFNAAVGPGTCVGDGRTTFAEFRATLEALIPPRRWNFSRDDFGLDAGGRIDVVSRGGEFHTFTEVKHFGGGCRPVPFLNLGQPPVAECQPESAPGVPAAFATSGVPAGGTLTIADVAPGTHLYQCLIHPWMRSVAVVEDDD
ncbi:MAG TPA: hypothetical protein VLK59_09440 [Solirubrobacteraceae bacterium]|nr:hypothetical protein [Solirubrobacteraceae bacterium]